MPEKNNLEVIETVKTHVGKLKNLLQMCDEVLADVEQLKDKNSITGHLLDEGLEKILGQNGFHLDRTAATAQELISILEKSLN